jgi:hypothetical protein
MSRNTSIDRRTLLRGAGAAISLPLLEAMAPTLRAVEKAQARPPARFVSLFFSLGVPLPPVGHPHRSDWNWFPLEVGRNFRLTEVHRALDPFRDQLSFINGMDHHRARAFDGHGSTPAWLTGADLSRGHDKNTVSIDQLIAHRTASDVFLPSLVLTSGRTAGSLSNPSSLAFDLRGMNVPGEHDPRRTFHALFGRDATAVAEQRRRLAEERSLLDLVLDDARALQSRLGASDRARLDSHLEAIRSSETTLARNTHWLDQPRPQVAMRASDLTGGYSTRDQLDAYYQSHMDTIALAFATDSSRTVNFAMNPDVNSEYQISKLIGLPLDTHGLSHDGGNPDYYRNQGMWCRYLTEKVAYLVRKLSETPEGDGSVLDRTVILYGCQTSTVHWNRNYPTMIIGGSKLGLQHGRYLHFPDGNFGNVLATLLGRFGIEQPNFAGATGEINELVRRS